MPISNTVDSTKPDSASDAPAKAEPQGANRRRSTRLLIAVPVILAGKDARGEKFREECRTIFINRQGATISTAHTIAPGAELLIENPPLRLTVRARTIRFLEKAAPGALGQVAVELIDQKNVWGIQYPPRDWQTPQPAPPQPEGAAPTLAPAMGIEVCLPGLGALSPVIPQSGSISPVRPSTVIPLVNSSAPAGSTSLPERELEKYQKIAAVKMTKLASEMNGKLEASLQEALARLEKKQGDLLALEERLQGVGQAATGSCASLEGLLSQVEEARRHIGEEVEKAQGRLQRVSEESLKSVKDEIEQISSQGAGSTASARVNEERQHAAQEIGNLFQEFKQDARVTLASLTEGALASSASELQEHQARIAKETALASQSALEGFLSKLKEAAQNFRDSTLSGIAQECSARSAVEIESQRAHALEEIKAQAGGVTHSGIEAFRTDLEQAATAFRESTLPEITREFSAQSNKELESAKAGISAQAKDEIQLLTRAELEDFRAQLEKAANGARELTARSAVEIENQRAHALEELKAQAVGVTHSGIEAFRTELEQAACAFRESTLPEITREFSAQSNKELESAKAGISAQAKDEIQFLTRAELADFRAQLEKAATGAREETISSVVREYAARSTEELRDQQSTAMKQAEEQIQSALRASLEGFQGELENRSRQFQKQVSVLIDQPAQDIAKYAGDTLLMVQEEADLLRKSFIEGVHTQLGAVTRGTLASMTAESKALAEEYRSQFRATFESVKEKGAAEIKSHIQDALDQGRELALRQLQKDAEDFGAVAVGQFRGKSEDAIREASEAVNKQVGAAAFVVKEWLDHGVQRLESHLGRMEKQSDETIDAIQNRSRDLSRVTLEQFRKESESLVLHLRQRIQGAADALAQGLEARPLEEEMSARSTPEGVFNQPHPLPE